MNTDNLKELFALLDLSDDVVKVYLELLKSGEYSPLELSKKLKIPRTKVYRVLAKLNYTELIQEIKTKKETKRFQAKDPQSILQLIHKKERELLIMKSSSINVVSQLKEFFDLNRQDEFYSLVEPESFAKIINSSKLGQIHALISSKATLELINTLKVDGSRFSILLKSNFSSSLKNFQNIKILEKKIEFEENLILVEENYAVFIIQNGLIHKIMSLMVFNSLKAFIASLN